MGSKKLTQQKLLKKLNRSLRETNGSKRNANSQRVFLSTSCKIKRARSHQDHDQDLALDREVFLHHLEQQVNREVSLDHPVEYEDVNLCQLYHQGRFEQFLKKLKISDLRSMCEQFNVALKGPLSRKATFIQALQELVASCSCLCDDH